MNNSAELDFIASLLKPDIERGCKALQRAVYIQGRALSSDFRIPKREVRKHRDESDEAMRNRRSRRRLLRCDGGLCLGAEAPIHG
jgi:hypothetical protein